MCRLAQSPRGTASDAVPHPLLLQVTKDAEGGINHPEVLPYLPRRSNLRGFNKCRGTGVSRECQGSKSEGPGGRWGKNDLEHPRDGGSRSRGIGEGRVAQRRGVWQKRVEKTRFCENRTPVGVYRLRTSPKHQSQTSSSPSISHQTDLATCPDQWN